MLNSRDVADWIAYSNIEPFGASHDELLHGMRCALYANSHIRDGEPPPTPSDFMPSYEPIPQSPEAIMQSVREWKMIANGNSS